jgi:NDP-sugar pyrophosphorylase family protein
MSIVLHESSHPEDSDILKLDEHNFVEKFISKHDDHTDAGCLGNAGLCIIEPEVLEYMEKDVFTFETYIYPKLLDDDEKIYGYVTDEIIHDIGTVNRLKKMENSLAIK